MERIAEKINELCVVPCTLRDNNYVQDLIAERMEKYARASGHPRLVELLSRHANDQKDKFTLSDDEDQARIVADSNETDENGQSNERQ